MLMSFLFPQNLRMQQPLCHLYFLTVLEHLWYKHLKADNNKVTTLTRLTDFVLKQLKDPREGEAVLLWIEVQAMVQVLMYHLASCLDPDQTQKLGNFQLIIEELNRSIYVP